MMLSNTKNLNKVSIASLLVALGIIYGDIGTSPLYVLSSIIGKREITEELVYGGISCVFWTLTLQTTFKYILLTLQADNRGEGGIFSLFALVRRYRRWLYVPAMVGAGTLLADGIITPPISVSSAVEGLSGVNGLENIIAPGNTLTVGIIIGILSLLFFFQQFCQPGTAIHFLFFIGDNKNRGVKRIFNICFELFDIAHLLSLF